MTTEKNPAPEGNGGAPAAAAGDNIDQIREILLGPHARKVSSQLDKTKKDLSEGLRSAVEDLNASITDLTKRLGREEKNAEARFTELDQRLVALDEALHGELAKQAAESHKSLKTLRDDLNKAVAKLADEKVARADFGDMLIELGMRLKGEASLKSIEATLKKSASDG